MVNKGRSATGILLSIGQARGGRFGVLYRHRRWLGTSGTFDLTGGGLVTTIRPKDTFAERTTLGVTGDIALGWRDYGQLSFRGDLVQGMGRTDASLYGGVRLGSRPAAVTAVTGGTLLAAYVIMYAIRMARVDDF
jgi:hypothetical protein